MINSGDTLTANTSRRIKKPSNGKSSNWKNFIEVAGARHNNLNNIDVKFPLWVITLLQVLADQAKPV
jgi:excinuclease ABC subunit A